MGPQGWHDGPCTHIVLLGLSKAWKTYLGMAFALPFAFSGLAWQFPYMRGPSLQNSDLSVQAQTNSMAPTVMSPTVQLKNLLCCIISAETVTVITQTLFYIRGKNPQNMQISVIFGTPRSIQILIKMAPLKSQCITE